MFKLPYSEYENRLDVLERLMAEKQLDAVYISGSTSFAYFIGYRYLPTERPAALVIAPGHDVSFLGPIMEKDHILLQSKLVSRTFTYLDYPGDSHPMKKFALLLAEIGLSGKRIGVDNPSFYSSPWGYKGLNLSDIMPGTQFVYIGEDVYNMRIVKSENEISLVKESVRWGKVAHEYLQHETKAGVYDWEVSTIASLKASREMKKTLGEDYTSTSATPLFAHAGFRGQVGVHSVYPHSLSIGRPIAFGDMLGTGASADVDGYHSELERNLFLGKPTEKMIHYHKIVLEMQNAAFDAMKPGSKCSDIDIASYRVANKYGLTDYVLHHTGHGMGLEGHEAPFLDIGDYSLLRPGMVMSLEPGLYIPGLGGFRHSDTIVIGEDGAEWITDYPRDTDSLTIL
jgi:Xaa-Pro dipeptidase